MDGNTFYPQLKKLKDLIPIVKAASNTETTALFKFLVERVKNPDSYVVMLGETSSGKSSLINGLLGENILPVSARPTTGSITEILFTNEVSDVNYFECTKDMNLRTLSRSEFEKMTYKPGQNTSRLRVAYPAKGFNPGLRLFDSPGYNSIIEEHEEVLRDFLPNADAIIYTVSYRIGIQNEDFNFLGFLKELIGPDVPVIVAVNRCPETAGNNDRRIKEITQYITDILGKKPEIFLVPITVPTQEGVPVRPVNPKMWQYVTSTLNSSARKDNLAKAFDGFIMDLFNQCDSIIKTRLEKKQMSNYELEVLINEQKAYADSLRQAIAKLIVPAFSTIKRQIPNKLNNVCELSKTEVCNHINNSSKMEMEEEVAYINHHLLPFTIRKNHKECVDRFLEVELLDLNDKVDDYIQRETIKFTDKIKIQLKTATDVVVSNLVSRSLAKLGGNGLAGYVVQFGGAGGTNAGLANAASHLLKKAGNLVGKTFSRTTHNSLKHVMKKIGATSMKKVGGAITVLVEILTLVYEMNTWQSKAKSKVSKGLEKWRQETLPATLKEIENLEKQNIETIEKIAYEQEHAYDDEMPTDNTDIEQLKRDSDLADQWYKMYRC